MKKIENIFNLTISQLEFHLTNLKEQKFRAKQLFEWLYKKQIINLDLMSNLSTSLKQKISKSFNIKIPLLYKVDSCLQDNSHKFLIKTYDDKLIESILMIVKKRVTLCISCMIGCPLKCSFCATGSELKFIRKLETFEILGQILTIQNYIRKNNIADKITNIVFMGMGEPLLNFNNVKKTIEILLDPNGFSMSKRKITISTAGIIDGLSEFINKYKIKLAISLHFPFEEQRSIFMPINRKISLESLIKELKRIKLAKRDYITIEYLMLNKINDTLKHAKQLVKILNGIKTKVNLIPYNTTTSFNVEPSSEENLNYFAKYIRSKNIMVTIRRSKGKKIKGGCGQFILNSGKK
ncbi:23S rRNA (adenine(2503)-C(2))-methyltransferase RlmN [Candidatus Babeliales bacterium]|nr:23S rRNA (adenine(2503)-C(2))-methyltransferase RlmN [Candidatus Babeliales bacterium]